MPPKKKEEHQMFPKYPTSPKNPWSDPKASWGSPPPPSPLDKLGEAED